MNEPPSREQIEKLLNWCLQCPSLLAPNEQLWHSDALAASVDWRRLTPSQLARIQEATAGKLGSFFETLIKVIFELSDRYQILAENRVIQGKQRTLGEIDLLVKDVSSKCIIHLELAVKFYLWVPDAQTNCMHWVGAGLKDFFAAKCQRLYQHQLRLPYLAQQSGCWPTDLPLPDQHLLWMPGRLYLPAGVCLKDTITEIPATPWQINPKAQRSVWQYDSPTQPLHKWQWLTGENGPENNIRAPYQCAWQENRPLFIVPKNWQTNALTKIRAKYPNHESV